MNQIVSSQSMLFLTSVEIGILMGALFDLIRIFRKLLKHPNFLVQIEDMLYWIVCGFVAFYMLYICNYAEIRPYIFIGIILGGIFYFATFSVVFMKIATIVINYIKAIIHKLIQWVIIPCMRVIKLMIRAVIGWIKMPIRYISKKWHHWMYMNKLRYRQYKRVRYEQKSDKKVEQYLKKTRT
ncbi:MAG: spore cortex biosynthesis protein YabQ [Cellulosilyticum sp.]|nr:spore cortex biosynthesis protein YabQ [Cellulosilyticum sp.]